MQKSLATLLVSAMSLGTASAQPPGQHAPESGGRSPNAVLAAIDSDGDHEITTDEMKNAFAALKKLDANNNGKLDREEIHPKMAGGPSARGGFDSPPSGGRRGGGPQGGRRGGPGGGPPSPEQMIQDAFEFDANKDGQLSKSELRKFAESHAQRRGPGRGRGGRGGPGGRNDGDRPSRPTRPE